MTAIPKEVPNNATIKLSRKRITGLRFNVINIIHA